MNLAAVPAFLNNSTFRVVVEAPRGSSLKLKYDPHLGVMGISRPLPLGLTYPFDWGFVPSTKGDDGDPLDAMLLWDVPSYPGVVVECRAIGVLQVEQNRVNHDASQRVRNDRVMAIPIEARRERDLTAVSLLPERVRQELEHFAVAATAFEGKDVRIVGWGDPAVALALIRKCAGNVDLAVPRSTTL